MLLLLEQCLNGLQFGLLLFLLAAGLTLVFGIMDLVNLAQSRGWALQELHQVGMSLEEVFIRVVAGEETEEAAIA